MDFNYPEHERPSYVPTRRTTTVRPTKTSTPATELIDECNTNYDAVTLIRNELFIFKGKYYWRFGANGRLDGYPKEINWMWPDLPSDLTHVDTVYERPDNQIAFFIGKLMYLFNTRYLVPGYPQPLTSLGLPTSLEKLDAAMVWGHNNKTYFYSGTVFWKFNEDIGLVELDYPRNMSMWKGVGYNIDSVFQWKDGKTYFFKGKGYWKFDDLEMRVVHEKQLPSAQSWMACPVPEECDTDYDAITLIRNELFIFKGKYFWRIGANGRFAGYPKEINRMWSDLPSDLTHVDTAYERPDHKIAFFVGKLLYLFNSQTLVPGYPQPLTSLGLPESLEKLDAAMVWGKNNKTYFYSGTMYWQLDEDEGRVELDYPRNMAMWKGVGYNIDSVFQWKNGKTYFFKGKGFWKFDDLTMSVEQEKQIPSAQFWMACPNTSVMY